MTGSESISPSHPPLLSPESNRKSGSLKQFFSILLSLFLGLFLVASVVSFADDSLIFFLGVHFLTGISAVLALFTVLASVLIYVLIGLTPLIPKRLFIPLTLEEIQSQGYPKKSRNQVSD